MQQLPKRETKKLLFGADARAKLLSGARQIREAVGSTYGPAGNDVILGMPYGDAVLTRDGVTVAKRIILPDTSEDKAAQILRQASEKTNRTAGDGTTATVVLGANLYERGLASVAVAKSPTQEGMRLRKTIMDDAQKIVTFLKDESLSGEQKLLEVATVSAGDPNTGLLISDTLKEIGLNGGITIREKDYPTLDVEKVQGYYFDRGFFAIQGEVKYASPHIFVTQKTIDSNADMVPILDFVLRSNNKRLVIIGDVRMNSDAMNTLLLNLMESKLEAVVVPPPAFGDESKLFMEDIGLYVGAKVYIQGVEPDAIDETYFGSAETTQVGPNRAVVFRGKGGADVITSRAADIKQALEAETGAHAKDQMEQRYSKLTGKIAIVNVGGSTPAEMEELRYRVEDAIEATKSAIADGVLPGGATMLVRAAELDISPIFKAALEDTFTMLIDNAAERGDHRLEQVRAAKVGFGFNLRDMSKEPIDLRKAGIWDATRAVIQTVENAASAAGSLLKTSTIVDPIEDRDERKG
jgi:chaperonin GroEL